MYHFNHYVIYHLSASIVCEVSLFLSWPSCYLGALNYFQFLADASWHSFLNWLYIKMKLTYNFWCFYLASFQYIKIFGGYRLISHLRGLNAFYAMFWSILCYLQFLLMCLLLDIWNFFSSCGIWHCWPPHLGSLYGPHSRGPPFFRLTPSLNIVYSSLLSLPSFTPYSHRHSPPFRTHSHECHHHYSRLASLLSGAMSSLSSGFLSQDSHQDLELRMFQVKPIAFPQTCSPESLFAFRSMTPLLHANKRGCCPFIRHQALSILWDECSPQICTVLRTPLPETGSPPWPSHLQSQLKPCLFLTFTGGFTIHMQTQLIISLSKTSPRLPILPRRKVRPLSLAYLICLFMICPFLPASSNVSFFLPCTLQNC